MSELLEPKDRAAAQDFLCGFSPADRWKGEQYWQEDRVREVVPVQPGRLFEAQVEGNFLYSVRLELNPDGIWVGTCNCPLQAGCKHVYAAMKQLLVDSTAGVVRRLSAGAAPGVPAKSRVVRSEGKTAGSLARRLAEAQGRPLDGMEREYLDRVRRVYARVLLVRQLYESDLKELGLSSPRTTWDPVDIWPSPPANEHEFWLYVALAFQERGQAIPAFMECITDLQPIQKRLEGWRRGKQVREWQSRLRALEEVHQWEGAPQRAAAPTDLRVLFTDERAELQWKPFGAAAFVGLPAARFRRMADEESPGGVAFTPEAELIREIFRLHFFHHGTCQMHYEDPTALDGIGRLLRLRLLHDRLVTEDGEPIRWQTERLRWELEPAESAEQEYRLRLVHGDGSAVRGIRFVVNGASTLVFAGGTVFPGPPVLSDVVDPTVENRIPAQALESREGVLLLESLGLDLPPRLRDRVRRVALKLAIRCELQKPNPFSKSEECIVQVEAVGPDGKVVEVWSGASWQPPEPRDSRKGGASLRRGSRDGQAWTLHDRTALGDVRGLLAPLELKWNGYGGYHSVRVTKKFPETFAAWMRSVPPHVDVRLNGELRSLAEGAVSGTVRLEASEAAPDWFDLRVVLDVSDTELTPDELKLLLNAKGGYVRLQGKGWRRLEFQLSEDEDERMARIGLSARELSAEPQRVHALQLADEAARKLLPEAQALEIQRRAGELKARVTPDLPSGIRAELRPYQRDGFHFLAYLSSNAFGGILADDMGLGKTLQTLTWLEWLRSLPVSGPSADGQPGKPAVPSDARLKPGGPSLVVCPKSVMDNWRAEAERFAPGIRVKVWSPDELAGLQERTAEADLHVLNYSQLRLVGEGLTQVRWLAAILDEGQYIKNPNSQTAQVARSIHARHRLVLTGTPIENRLLDLWSLMAFAMPGVLGSRAQFGRLYDAKGDPLARRRLSARVRPFLLRRTKSQVAKDLPDRVEEDLYCEMEGEQKSLYRAELKRAQQILLRVETQKQLAKERFHFLTSLLRLRQICCHPRLVQPTGTASSAKLEALMDQLEPLMDEGNKVLVFSQFVELLRLLQPAIAERGWTQHLLTGETENRGDLVHRFQETPGAGIFLLSLKAGGFGLNLTAASYVVLFDPWWNPAVENQAIDRTHRIGQVNKVMAYRLLIKGSVEEKIRQLQKQKGALAEDVLGEERFAESLTLEDLRYLLAD